MNITNEVVTRYIDGLYRPLTSELAELRRQAEADHIPVILRDTERFLVSMLTLIRPRRITANRSKFCSEMQEGP